MTRAELFQLLDTPVTGQHLPDPAELFGDLAVGQWFEFPSHDDRNGDGYIWEKVGETQACNIMEDCWHHPPITMGPGDVVVSYN